MKRSPLKRKTRLRRQSRKQKNRLQIYYWLREPWMKLHPICEICKEAPSTDVHHRKYRYGPLLFDQRWWMAVCRRCHKKIHENVKWARQMGYLVYD